MVIQTSSASKSNESNDITDHSTKDLLTSSYGISVTSPTVNVTSYDATALAEETIGYYMGWYAKKMSSVTACRRHSCANSCNISHDGDVGCFCDARCTRYGDCCPDYYDACLSKTEQGYTWDAYVGHPVLSEGDNVTTMPPSYECVGYIHGCNYSEFMLIQTCHSNFHDSEIKNDCVPYSYSLPLMSRLPVTSHNGRTYLNYHCALCNGELTKNLRFWRTNVSCDSDVSSADINHARRQNVSYFINFLDDACKVVVIVPKNDPDSYRPCEGRPMIHTCDDKHREKVANFTRLKNLCFSYYAPLKITSTYKNVHCASCNDVTTSTFECPRRRKRRGATCPITTQANKFNPGTTSFAILFDLSQKQDLTVSVIEHMTCTPGYTYDILSEECLEIFCLKGFTLQDGVCIPHGNDYQSRSVTLSLIYYIQSRLGSLTSPDVASMLDVALSSWPDKPDHLYDIKAYILNAPASNLSPMETNNNDQIENEMQSALGIITIATQNLTDWNIFEEFIPRSVSKLQNNAQHPVRVFEVSISNTQDDVGIKVSNGWNCSKWTHQNSSLEYKHDRMVVRDNATGNMKYIRETSFKIFNIYDDSRLKDTEWSVKACQWRQNAPELSSCAMIQLRPEQYRFENGTLIILKTNKVYTSNNFRVMANVTYLCINVTTNYQKEVVHNMSLRRLTDGLLEGYLTFTGLILSLIGLLLTFAAHAFLPELRTFPGKNLMNLIVSLFFAQFFFSFGMSRTEWPTFCMINAVIEHYLWLVSFFSMNVISFDVFRTFARSVMSVSETSGSRRLMLYIIYTWCSPLLVVGSCFLIFIFGHFDKTEICYGSQTSCFLSGFNGMLYGFIAPVMLIVLINFGFFVAIIIGINRATILSKRVQKSTAQNRQVWLYLKLSTIMGFTWIFGLVATVTGMNPFWYMFIAFNTLQGVFMFFAFACTSRVKYLCQRRWRSRFSHTAGKHTDSSFSVYSSMKNRH